MSFDGADMMSLHHSLMRSSMRRFTGSAADVVQETYLRMWKGRDQYEDGTNLGGWANAILKNVVLEQRRGLAPKIDSVSIPLDDMRENACRGQPPSQDTHIALLQAVERISKLSPTNAKALRLIAFEEMSYAEAGEQLGIPGDIVKSQVHRARKALAEDKS